MNRLNYCGKGMWITITEFEDRSPQLLPGSSVPIEGYWIKFQADIVSGRTLLVPAGSGIEELHRGLSLPHISVETSQKAVLNFRLLDETEDHDYRFEPLQYPGDYGLRGRVSNIWVLDDGTLWAVYVIVGTCGFDISPEEVGINTVQEGVWVQFQVLQLEFDENL